MKSFKWLPLFVGLNPKSHLTGSFVLINRKAKLFWWTFPGLSHVSRRLKKCLFLECYFSISSQSNRSIIRMIIKWDQFRHRGKIVEFKQLISRVKKTKLCREIVQWQCQKVELKLLEKSTEIYYYVEATSSQKSVCKVYRTEGLYYRYIQYIRISVFVRSRREKLFIVNCLLKNNFNINMQYIFIFIYIKPNFHTKNIIWLKLTIN